MNRTRPSVVGTALLFQELQDLKRIVPAHLPHSIATDLFRKGWQGIIAGEDLNELALDLSLRALLSILFPGVDGHFFRAAGMDRDVTEEVLRRALQRSGIGRLPEVTIDHLSKRLPVVVDRLFVDSATGHLPEPLEVLCRQPRAGATHPELPRLVLAPAEMHSDHCLLTAVYGVLLADEYGADSGTVLLASLAHHLHNAYLPDCGYAGEICLGEHLQSVIDNCRATALQHFTAELAAKITAALVHHESITDGEGRAVSAGDVLDRVLDVKWRTRAAGVTDVDILGELDLVHPGPLKSFQSALLNETGIWTA